MHHGRPYADKPRLFLDETLFTAETDNAFRIDGDVIIRREGGIERRLTVGPDSLRYDDGVVRVDLTRDWRMLASSVTAPFEGIRSLGPAAEMLVLFEGIRRSLPFLLVR